MRSLLAALLLTLVAATACAESVTIPMRVGEHPGFGRLVFDLPPEIKASVMQGDGQVVVTFDPPGVVAGGMRMPRNVQKITATPGRAEIAVVAGAQVRSSRLGTRLVLDIGDAASGEVKPPVVPKQAAAAGPAVTSSKPATRAPAADLPRPPTPPASAKPPLLSAGEAHWPDPEPSGSNTTEPAVSPAPTSPVAETPSASAPRQAPPSLKIAAAPGEAVRRAADRSVLIPFDPSVAAAAFRRGADAVVVFDQRRPIDLAGLRGDKAFASASVTLLPNGTILRMPLAADEEFVIAHVKDGWTLTLGSTGDKSRPTGFDVQREDGALRFTASDAGGVVAVPDNETGAALMVGTVHDAGKAVPTARRTPEFSMPATWLGLVIDPISDRIALRATSAGFVVSMQPEGQLAIGSDSFLAPSMADARHFTRRFDFPSMPVDGLLRRLQAAQSASAARSPMQRGERRRDVAEAMITLGLGAEAQAVLTLSGADDGRLANDPDRIGLQAIAAMLAGRPKEAGGIDDHRLDGTDEVNLWRGFRTALLTEGAPAAAAVFAADLPLLLSYPDTLRDRMLSLAVETMATGGEQAAATRVVDQFPGKPELDLARALLARDKPAEPGADRTPVYEAFDKAAGTQDRLVRARAVVGGIETRLADGKLTPRQAADQLDKVMYAWRGDDRERALRLRIAALRAQSAQWRPALALLRETEQAFPDDQAAVRAQLRTTFAEALRSDIVTPMPPLDLVALAEENIDLLPDGEAGQAVASRIADRLSELDLPQRASSVLEKMLSATTPGLPRAEIGSRLATTRQRAGDHAGALAALTSSESDEVTPDLAARRTLVFARSAAALGDMASAMSALTQLDSTPALELRAELLERRQDWRGAEAALQSLVDRVVPKGGALSEADARLVLRLATAAAQAGDNTTLAAIRDRDSGRVPKGKLADLLNLLTGQPIQGVGDLPRAAQEAKLAKSFPVALKSLTP